MDTVTKEQPKKSILILVSFFFGWFGIDRLMLGYKYWWLKLLTFAGFGLWWLVDLVLIIFSKLNPVNRDK
ncbi:MAG: TM2 domain-containing protein [Sporocytophaga sp.]|uniref:TM2 domain-containing protein n=1 Tax=Sporocytophaga sp. TaxID=2231183 RepID=UPI001B029846|nr:TM2 domain-containing protein [Sporocytophaga sp.]MBO9700209.1 TM2 domain-containing protein [Sporocytophaga sp.]